MFLTCVALATLLMAVAMALETGYGFVALKRLADIVPADGDLLPSISIVAAARNEQRNIRAGVLSLLMLDYPGTDVIIVNDRSTDATADILAALSRDHSKLRVLTVTELPVNWLGKNHALNLGAQSAAGDYLLFTDADVVMDHTVLRRAIRYAQGHDLDHLAIGPAALMPGVLLNMFMVGFTVFFNLFTRPWRARNPQSKAHIGIGAFNLVRRSVYEKLGGHAPIALRPDDDLKLGKLMKKSGHRSDFLIGAPLISVEWYGSVGELVRGLEKNAFAGCNYNLGIVAIGMVMQIWLFQWPFVAIVVTEGWIRAAYAASVIFLLWIATGAARAQRLPVWQVLGLPLASVMFVFIVLRSTFLTLRNRGITWRDTFYPLEQLKKNVV